MSTTSITPVNGLNTQVNMQELMDKINSGKLKVVPAVTPAAPKPDDRPKATVIATAAPKPTFQAPPANETPEQELARLRAENAALKHAKSNTALSCRVSDKGAVSVYGLGKFPVTLYKEQWERLLNHSADLLAFIEAHASELKTK